MTSFSGIELTKEQEKSDSDYMLGNKVTELDMVFPVYYREKKELSIGGSLPLTKQRYRNPVLADLYFDENRLMIKGRMQEALYHIVRLLQREVQWKLRIEGYCDSHGSSAYNMARANFHLRHLSSYLRAIGLASDRIDLMNIGQTPFPCWSDSEQCQEDNLRAEHIFPIFSVEYVPRGCLARLRVVAGKDWDRAVRLLKQPPFLQRIHVASPSF